MHVKLPTSGLTVVASEVPKVRQMDSVTSAERVTHNDGLYECWGTDVTPMLIFPSEGVSFQERYFDAFLQVR